MRTVIRAALLQGCLLLCGLASAAGTDGRDERIEEQLESIARELAGGIARGDWAPWQKHASDDLLYTTEFGRTMTKEELRAIFRPLPPPQRRILAVTVTGSRVRGEAAVLVYELVGRGGEGESDERYRATDTYWRVGGRWRLVASHVGRVEEDGGPAAAPAGRDAR